MSLFGTRKVAETPGRDTALQHEALPDGPDPELSGDPIAGDRGIPSVNRARSIQSRASSVLAIGLMSTLGVGLLTWYYAKALSRPAQAHQAAQAAAKAHAQGEMALPSLGPIAAPAVRGTVPPSAPAEPQPVMLERIVGPAPPPPLTPVAAPAAAPAEGQVKSPGVLAFERRLAGPAFARASHEESGGAAAAGGAFAGGDSPGRPGAAEGSDPTLALNSLLRPTVTPAVAASVLPTRQFLLAKGAFIDCTLETAIDSTLPGMTTCITATDTFSADGTVVLLERGTKLVGETRGQVQQGSSRLFVLWTEARTSTGVVVPLSSPGTDELGRSGLTGEVNRHFWDRFGAAILLTVINGAVQGAVQSQSSGSSVIVSPTSTSDVMTEVLRSTVNIPPTVTKAQGDRIQVFVARDVDFRSVYTLRVANERPAFGASMRAETAASEMASASALELNLRALGPILKDPEVTELCINRPGQAFVETRRGWEQRSLPFADFDWCRRLAKLIANSTRQRIDESTPLLSASLPTGERAQIVLPPATSAGTVAITLRRPSDEVWSIGELARRGIFRSTRRSSSALDDIEQRLLQLLKDHEYETFMRLAVASRKNILVSGPTGSGKTTWTKALIREIPEHERLVTIEDAQELVLDTHPNHVRLFYSKDDQGLARVTPKQLLESCLRMKPDRILLAELRAEEAFDYLRNVNSGHPGSITSIHAGSCELAFEQLVLLVKQSVGGRELARADIKSLLYLLVDVVIQFGVERHERFIKEIWYEPERRRRGLAQGG